MTAQTEILNDPNYIPVLDYGFVGIVDHMGDDTSIVQAARVSYGAGTKTVREDRGLIRYLFRHRHTSPFEMCEAKFHVRCPIVVMRQLVRHRTANLNEYSGRYSVMTDEFYIPELDVIQPQSDDNKQGRSGDMSNLNKEGVRWMFQAVYETAYDCYQAVLGERDKDKFIQKDIPFGAYDEDDPVFDNEFPGVAREVARCVLPVGNYTELYWKQDLHNLFHLMKLRLDPHAQYEIRVFAEAIYKLVQPIYPLACEAFNDFQLHAQTMSRMEMVLLKEILADPLGWTGFKERYQTAKEMAEAYGMSVRELNELKQTLNIV
jgi:thymidylate synthase (FAD)